MKVLILAGGMGTRISEETSVIPKPMIEIGGRPILWHIMKTYSYYGFNEFIVLTGYKSHVIKDYFINYYTRYSDITVDMAENSVEIHKTRTEPWKVTMLFTGQDTMTGGRIKRAEKYVNDETFLLTYGDGVADINIPESIKSHKESGKLATMTAVKPTGRYGAINVGENNEVHEFIEKPQGDNAWINGGFFVLEPEVLNYIDNYNSTTFEKEPLENLAKDNQLNAYKHDGFWKCMDTLRDKIELSHLWFSANPPWAVWNKTQMNNEVLIS